MTNLKKILRSTLIAIILIILFSFFKIVRLYTDFQWFKAIGYTQVFTITLKTKILLFLASAIIFYLFAAINLRIATKLHKSDWSFKLGLLVLIPITYIVAIITTSSWDTVLKYFNQVLFNLTDPILNKDAAFYVFSLPFLNVVLTFLFWTVLLTLIITALHYLKEHIVSQFKTQPVDDAITTPFIKKPKRPALIHLAIIGSFLFFLLTFRDYLSRYAVMYSEQGVVVGAGYTDVVIFLPAVKMLMILAFIVGIAFYGWIFFFSKKPLRKKHILMYLIILYIAFMFVGKLAAPAIVQSLKVSPNEMNLERPYIENNIEFTKIAYGLDNVNEQNFKVTQNITPQTLENAKETIDNVRILDYRPLTSTYKQMQEIRLYYDLSGIDIDRYNINNKYSQVMLAARELEQEQITPNAKTWVNLHTVYTHGFGAVMIPVNKVTKEGLPEFLIQDIPPQYATDEPSIKIDEPRIYYGEVDNNYVLVGTSEEFDYPKGETNEYTTYSGTGGVKLNSFFKKLMMAITFGDIKILLSSDITKETKIQYNRNIQKRIHKIAPYLELDKDPYLVIGDGKMYWIQDAYTTTSRFPYSEKIQGINYIRNSVKVVVDAYNGDVTYYVADNEPIIDTFSNIYPGLYKPISEMPETLKDHLRYPEDLFKIQTWIYSTYHMNDVTVFYNKEDAWEIPSEIYGTGQEIKVEPYYLILKLPGEDKEEFVLMTTFTPLHKDNMISWLAARTDGENYGKLLLYRFPKDTLVYGPFQVEAKIDQHSEISQQLTLWSQQGSRVTRGNLLVIPIDHSLLYIEPLYIQAEKGQLPELKRVIVSDGERVVMEETLSQALNKLFGSRIEEKQQQPTKPGATQDELSKIKDYYNKVDEAMKKGDWTNVGLYMDKIGELLE